MQLRAHYTSDNLAPYLIPVRTFEMGIITLVILLMKWRCTLERLRINLSDSRVLALKYFALPPPEFLSPGLLTG